MTKEHQNKNKHIPVLLEPVLQVLRPVAGERYLDLTAGYGGHATAILGATKAEEQAVLVDRDNNAMTTLQSHFTRAELRHEDFLQACHSLSTTGRQFDIILADLGVSSPHLDDASRGFSFMHDGPLDMRMDQRRTLSADTIINTWSEADIADALFKYGEEPAARRFAAAIAARRPLHTTTELADVIEQAAGGRRGKIHPATRSFQALRIVVNDELVQVKEALPLMMRMLAPGGRMAVISFHSLEDRIVKQFFQDQAGNTYDAPLQLITKKPISGDQKEIVFNPRARSAKLRAAVKK